MNDEDTGRRQGCFVAMAVAVVGIGAAFLGVLGLASDIAAPALLGRGLGMVTAWIVMLAAGAGATWRRVRPLSVLLAIAALGLSAATIIVPRLALAGRATGLTEAQREAPRREYRGASAWAVHRELGFEMSEPLGLRYVEDDALMDQQIASMGSPQTAGWRWSTPDESRQIMLVLSLEDASAETEQIAFLDGITSGMTRSLQDSGLTVTASERPSAFDREIRAGVPGAQGGMFGRCIGYPLGDRFVAAMVLATARGDLRSLERIVQSARAISDGTPPPGAPGPIASGDLGVAARAGEGAPVAGPWPVASAGAFDLIADAHGAMVVWADPLERGGAIHAVDLGPEGQQIGERIVLLEASTAHVREIAIARSGERVGVAWVESDGRTARASAAIAQRGAALGAPTELGQTPAAAGRGQIAIAALPDGTFVAAARGAAARASITVAVVGGTAMGRERRRITPITLDAPCDETLIGAVGTATGAQIGLCDGAPGSEALVLATLDADGALASPVDRRPLGCSDFALLGDGPGRVVDRCGAAVHIGGADGVRTAIAGDDPVRCDGERPALGLVIGDAAIDLTSVLPLSVSSAGSRAIWTGDAVLVAARVGPDLVIQRRQCQAGALLRSDLL